ncbi:ferrochelatase [Chamaesiphon polymorphus]|uniref:Ferrochelatase n=1 Tax=Chamaesiphon polymorphus CCALA 037 TaxID=2107692 RepID=A0A2T1GLY7_9CYAN|nr:ferrochelatase [Chamaesiphon polymorphus]PSB58901.1 ferrochelatase [Chamaesiphon polymorphus CCALA 037]
MGRLGVLLLNLGGPEQLSDVRPFLFNLFSDPEIIRIPIAALQKPLAWLISSSRAKKSQANYEKIGGGSPLRRITEAQARALESQLRSRGEDAKVYIGMRYWHPFTEDALAQIKQDAIEQLVILPLYPQFSISTSGSSFRLIEKIWNENPQLKPPKYTVIADWYKEPGYLQAMSDLICAQIDKCPDPDNAHVFFSAHGVPVSYVEEAGDPYQTEIEECTELIMQTIGRKNAHSLAYQSKVGPIEWLQPYTEDAIVELADKGVGELVVVPISFVSEHIETLEEIDIEYREIAEEAGIHTFNRVPALDTNPIFIQTLVDLVLRAAAAPSMDIDRVTQMKKKIKMYPQEKWEWGLTTAAEVWNGRLAMLGFIGIVVELISGRGPLHLFGIL